MNAVIEATLARSLGTDADRPAWLAARRTVCTATEARKISTGARSTRDRAIRALVAEKISGEEKFKGNRYTQWGNYREPVILATLRTQMGFEVAGHLIHAEGNPRHAATPDAWKVDEWTDALEICEIKTGKNDIAPGSGATYNGYLRQMWWQIYCTGAQRCLYVWEPNDGNWSGWEEDDTSTWLLSRGPSPLPLGTVWIERDAAYEAGVAEMIAEADRLLEVLDAETAKARERAESEEPAAVVDTQALDEALADYLEEKHRGETALLLARRRLEEAITAAGLGEYKVPGLGSVTLSDPEPPKPQFDAKGFLAAEPDHAARFMVTPDPVPVFDPEKFKAEEPEAYAKWLTTPEAKTDKTLRVTPARTKKETK